MLAEGMSISAVSRVLGIPEGTISCWLYREGKRLLELNEKKLKEMKRKAGFEGVEAISVDEMWSYVGARKKGKRKSVFVWTAWIKPKDGKGLFTFEVGERDEETLLKAMGEDTVC